MTVSEFITRKRDGERHNREEFDWFVSELVRGGIPDYQASAWLMASYLNGLDEMETAALTEAVAASGKTLHFRGLYVVDKHSTGGVGDAVTPILLPIVAACGVPIVKLAGRGLGFTGGTIDKMASIPGFSTNLKPDEMRRLAKTVGCALAEQTCDLAPADGILYKLRGATETVDSLPLIAASIMSKKLAGGADAVMLDVKAGSGAFMPSLESAKELAYALVSIGKQAGKGMRALITDMNQPLAPAVGNALEIRAAVDELRSGCRDRLGRVVKALAEAAVELAGVSANVAEVIESGRALMKMSEWIQAQGGDPAMVDDPSGVLPRAPFSREAVASEAGFVEGFQTSAIGEIARDLGAGRRRVKDEVDPAVGMEVRVRIGDRVEAGSPLFTVHARSESDAESAARRLSTLVSFSDGEIKPPPVVHAQI